MLKAAAISFVFGTICAAPAIVCGDGGPQPDLSIVSCELAAGQTATLLVVPDGTGPAFTEARDPAGVIVNATVRLTLNAMFGLPVANFPAEDMWIGSDDGGLACCAGGGRPDRNTDRYGITEWTFPQRAGGHSQASCRVYVNGLIVTGGTMPALHFNSPDMNGDLAVTLADVPQFALGYFGPYAFASDLQQDGAVNLGDIVVLARSIGAGCQ